MWTLGHFCIGYLFSRPLYKKGPIKPISLLSILFMAVVLDSVHVYDFRPFMHSMVFFLPFTCIILLVLYKLDIFKRNEILPLFVASLTHVFGDILFGSFAPFAPISYKEVGIFTWGSYFHLTVEISLFALFMIVLIRSGDLKKLIETSKVKSKEKRGQRLYQNVVLIIFILATIGQIGAILYLDILRGENFYNGVVYNDGSMWYISLLFMTAQIIFLYILSIWAMNRFKKSNQPTSNEGYED
jgi:hypothetical protein